MKVGILGLWHLGTVTAACTAAAGIPTIGVDDHRGNLGHLRHGRPPVFEPGLADLIAENLATGTLSFSDDVSAFADVDVVWVCYDTPVDDDDRADVGLVVHKVEATFGYLRDRA